jgi:hypothetical protein
MSDVLCHVRYFWGFFLCGTKKQIVTVTTYLDTLHAVTPVGRSSDKFDVPARWCAPSLGSYFPRIFDMHFLGRGVGRDGQILWSPRSPDIKPLDFFLWGYVKDIVYNEAQDCCCDRKSYTANAGEHLEGTEYCLDISRAMKGDHVEVV